MIQIQKRNGTCEPFSETKLTACIYRPLKDSGEQYHKARRLARVVRVYLQRTGQHTASSENIFDMALKVMRRVGLDGPAELLEVHHTLRHMRRKLLVVRHEDGRITQWDKTHLADLAKSIWGISDDTARLIAADLEIDLLRPERRTLTRDELINLLNARMSHFGLVDAVPSGIRFTS